MSAVDGGYAGRGLFVGCCPTSLRCAGEPVGGVLRAGCLQAAGDGESNQQHDHQDRRSPDERTRGLRECTSSRHVVVAYPKARSTNPDRVSAHGGGLGLGARRRRVVVCNA